MAQSIAPSTIMDYIVLFDISEKGYNWLPALIGLVFIVVGIVGLRNTQFAKAIKPHPIVPLLLGIILGFGSMWFQYNNRHYYEQLLEQNQALIVEGFVEDFRTWPKGNHGEETFTVSSIRFAYSNASITPAFTTTQAYGGPLHKGLYVRIHYTQSREFAGRLAILRIETKQ